MPTINSKQSCSKKLYVCVYVGGGGGGGGQSFFKENKKLNFLKASMHEGG